MRAVRNVARSNRTVMTTIHQPSMEIFESFDMLVLLQVRSPSDSMCLSEHLHLNAQHHSRGQHNVLRCRTEKLATTMPHRYLRLRLQRGGRLTYFGPLGYQSCELIRYLEAFPGVQPIKDGYNPGQLLVGACLPVPHALRAARPKKKCCRPSATLHHLIVPSTLPTHPATCPLAISACSHLDAGGDGRLHEHHVRELGARLPRPLCGGSGGAMGCAPPLRPGHNPS